MPMTRSHRAKLVPEDEIQQGGASNTGDSVPPGPPRVTATSEDNHSMVSVRTAHTSAGSGKSSNTIREAQILAAKAEHARKLAKAQEEREHALAERDAARERAVAELELEAKIAAIEASNSSRHSSHHSSRYSGYSYRSRALPRQSSNASRGRHSIVEDWLKYPDNLNKQSGILQGSERSTSMDNIHNVQAQQQPATRGLPVSMPPPPAEPAVQTSHTLDVGTHNMKRDCLCYTNKCENSDVGTPFTQLAKAITDLGKKNPAKVCDILKFDGRAADWLPFRKSYDQSKAYFSSSENVARLSAALSGAAKEAVAFRLIACDDPTQIMQALETRFAQPEVIILHLLSQVRALPRLNTYESPRDLNTFACRIRNCVEAIRLLKQPEYLSSPELVNSIIGKLTPLLRSRWADFASARVDSGKFKLEILASFLENEAHLQTKFGVILTESIIVKSPPTKSNPCQPNKDKIFPYTVSSTSEKPKSIDIVCKYCSAPTHEISDCRDFQSLCLDDRWQWVLDNKVCRKCLKKGTHSYRNCKKRCKIDGCTSSSSHHTLLHRIRSENTANTVAVLSNSNEAAQQSNAAPCQSATVAHSAAPGELSKPLLKVIPVVLTGPKGSINVYALLDDGSSATLVDKAMADMLVDEQVKVPLEINCVGGLTKLTEVSFINISIRGRDCKESYNIRARSIPDLGLRAQSTRVENIKEFKHLSDIAEFLAYDTARPTCLIGTDHWFLLQPQILRRGTNKEPAAVYTPLGWALFGFVMPNNNPIEYVNHCEVNDDTQNLDSLLKHYYKLDSIGIQKNLHRSSNDKRALAILESTTVRLSSGRFQTGLLWQNNLNYTPDSKPLALSRFYSLEKRMAKDMDYAAAYKQNIQDTIEKGYAELCTGPPLGTVTWYLPHFGVVHPHKKKLRVVHDAAAKSNGVSLNSMLLAGPDLLQPLLAIVMRFREGLIGLTADIKEMFPQIKIRPEDRDAQRFFWRDNADKPLLEYRMSSMIFGATSSPCTALFVKNKNAAEFQHCYPEAARCIIDDHYMDDFLGSVNDVEEAARLAREIVTVHEAGGFQMRSWVSNMPDALSLISPNLRATETTEVGLGPTSSSPSETRVLGLSWLIANDSICFLKSTPAPPREFTKRSALSLLMSVYDPLGFMTPLIIKGRILFQKTWKLGLDWDHNLPENLERKWKSWVQELENFSGRSVPRCYSGVSSVKDIQLHVFADASELAYACVAYWRFTLWDDSIKLALISGKSRLAPIKPTTIPRLELQASLIAARLTSYICEAHRKVKPNKVILWSDSITVLRWLRSDASSFKSFVSFRIAEILDITDVQSWRYVPTSLNVADDATRDSGEFSLQCRWLTGPSFLLSPEKSWPSEPINNEPTIAEEHKVTSDTVAAIVGDRPTKPLPVVADYRRFSKWPRLLRATARAHQAARVFRGLKTNNPIATNASRFPFLDNNCLNSAEHHLFLAVQLDSFVMELECLDAGRPVHSYSKLRNVSLLLVGSLLRLSGRTSACTSIESQPIVLDGKHQITRLLIDWYHTRYAHANNELVVNELHQRYYIVGLRSAVKLVASRCQACRIRKAKPVIPPTGDLPNARLAHHERPFTYVGLDYFGPISVTIGRRTAKRWVALFTCLTVRAVHLELVESLSSDSAIMALRRFIARRGCPACIYSDNGTAFIGAAKLLGDLFEFAADKKIQWKFIPPSAPFMGGCWERLVRNVKNALNVTLQQRSPREETLVTLLAEAEAIVNSRPLTHVPVDPKSDVTLTPFTFLIGSSSTDFMQTQQFDDTDLSSRAQWRRSQSLADHFWKRFVAEYLPTLIPRKGSTSETRSLGVGDLVCIADGNLPRRCWPRGKIIATYPGKDNIVRVVDVLTQGGVLRRPVRKLALLIAS